MHHRGKTIACNLSKNKLKNCLFEKRIELDLYCFQIISVELFLRGCINWPAKCNLINDKCNQREVLAIHHEEKADK